MHHGLESLADGVKSSQSQEVECRSAQRGHHAGAIAAVAVVVFSELGVPDPVPAFQAPAITDQLQQGFWRGAQTGDEPVGGLKRLALAGAGGSHLHDPGTAGPVLLDVSGCLFRPQIPGDVTAVTKLVIRCGEGDPALPLELTADLTVQRSLVGLDRQEEVGPLLLELPKNGFCVWSASA